MPRRSIAALAVVGVLFCVVGAAGASPRRVAVLQPDPELYRAVSLALSPWGIQTTRSAAAGPAAASQNVVQAAAELSRRLHVEALVWVTALGDDSLLWVFDAGAEALTTRPLTESPPFSGASAAAVALSVKTVLRSSALSPDRERYGSITSPQQERRSLALEIGGGGHWTGERRSELSIELASVLWLSSAPGLGLRLDVSTGPGFRVERTGYAGRYTEAVLGAAVRYRVLDAPAFFAVVGLRGEAHWARLHGEFEASSLRSTVDRINGSVGFETSANARLRDRLYLGVALDADYYPTYRRYLIDGMPVLSPGPITANITGYLGVELF